LVSLIVHKEQTSFIKGRFILDNLIIDWEGLECVRESISKRCLFQELNLIKHDIIECDFILNMLD
jgi:hypothetical protein